MPCPAEVEKLVRFRGGGPRLKSLDEFEKPEFVGRMARAQRRRKLAWYGTIASAIVAGAAIGFLLF